MKTSLPKLLSAFICLLLAFSTFSQTTTTFNYSGSIVNYTVPVGVTQLTIEAWGAEGGSSGGNLGGKGAYIKGTFVVTPGEVLRILVGQKGGNGSNSVASGGGGGTFIVRQSGNMPLLIAGGGGGGPVSDQNSSSCPRNPSLAEGKISTSGSSITCDVLALGGANGLGGQSRGGSGRGGAGAGFSGNGESGSGSCSGTGGISFLNGGAGGVNSCTPAINGGFGGGGAGGYESPGGGGGYSGGATAFYDFFFGDLSTWGGGGGSYNVGLIQNNLQGVRTGNGLVTITTPIPAGALKFDPSLTPDDNSRLNYVSVNNPYRDFEKEITVEFWMNTPEANLQFGSVMGQGTSNVDNNWVWLMHPNRNGTMTFYIVYNGGFKTVTCNIRPNEWHHYAATASATSTKFYVDGVKVDETDGVPANILSNSSSVIHIGKDVRYATRNIGNNDPTNRYAPMTIDELRIWSRALCQEEINANKNVEINPTGQNGLQEYYRFNQGFVGANNSTVTTLTDLSGNNRNGTLNNFTLNGTSSNWAASGSTNTGIVNAYVPPTAPILGGTSICMGQSTTLTNVNAGGTWTSSNTGVATINAATGQVTTVSAGTTTITYTTVCGGVSTTTFTVNAIPSVTIAAVGGTTGCPSSSVTLNATAPNGSTYQWFKNGALINGASGVSYNATSSGSYTAVATNNGCVSAVSNAVAITIADVTPPTITCPGNKVLASCDAVIPDYTTSATATDNCTASNSIVITQSPVAGTPIASGATITVTLTARDASNNTNSCNFTVNRPNVTPVAVDDNATVCAGGSVNISVLNNDTHPQGLPLTISDNAVPSVGTLVKNANNTFTYTAPVGYSGPVTFTYTTKANDGTQAFSGNGHYYEFVSAPGISWTDARAAASARTFNGLRGYLVTITSAAENAFMFNKVGTTAWIGGSDAAEEGVWRWMDGPEAGQQFSGQNKTGGCSANVPAQLPNRYHNWAPGEPNDCGGSGLGSGAENYAHFRSDGLWNDLPNGASVSGYAVEYGGLENCLPQLTATATVTINVTLTTATIAAVGETSTCPGNSVTLNATASSGSTYQWYKDGVIVPNASNASYNATETGSYTAIITNNGCVSAPSNAITVTVVDAVKPTITCPPNQTIDLDANCKATLPDYRSLLTVSDNCTPIGSLVITQSPAAGSEVNNKGSMIVTFTVRDASGNESTCTITIEKKDVTGPIVTCPAPIVVNATTNTCGAVVTFTSPNATDNCGIIPFTSFRGGEPNQFQGALQDYLQLYTDGTWDDLQNTTLNKWIVEFNTIITTSFPGYTRIGEFGGHTYYVSTSTATWINARVSAQSIGGDLVSINTQAENSFVAPSGIAWVGGYQDLSDSKYIEPGNASQNYGGWKWVDGTSMSTPKITITQTAGLPSGSVFPVGVTTNTFIARDESGNESTCSFTVTVRDVQPPVISCPANINVTATSAAGAVVNYTTPVGTDNCGGATTERTAGLASGSTFPIGTTTVTYRVTDAAGLFTECSFTVTVVGVAPVISCPANITVNAAAGTCAANVNFAATETVGIPASTITYTINGNPVVSGASFPVGTTTVVATATNAVGSSSCSFTVTVVDNQNPTITAPADVQGNNTAGLCTGTVTLGAPVTSDNCGVASVTNDAPITGIFPVGTTTVIWTVTDIHGNKSTATQTVVIVDNEKPTISVTNVNVNNDAGKCGASITIAQPITADNCDIASVVGVRSDNASLSAEYPVGTTTITWKVTDIHGNDATTTQTVVVNDTELPVVKTNNIVIQLGANGQASITTSQINNGSTDNCAIASIVLDKMNFNCSNVGENTVLLTVTDIHGNSASANAIVTVQDNILPTVITQPVTVTLVNGAASVTAAQVNNGSFDNCGIATMTVSPANFNCNNIGSNTVILTVTDVNGNTNTRSAIVTVVGQLPSCSITSAPTSNVFTGGNPNNLYLGYGAQSTVLNVAATGGSSYTYQWSGTATQMLSSTTAAAPVFTPTAPGNYTFTVTVTNNFGCTSTCSITICVKDIRVPGTGLKGSPAKVYICHVPPGNPNNPQTLEISVNAVATHIGKHDGDRLGTCAMTPCAEPAPTTVSNALTSKAVVEGESKAARDEELKVTVMPNPSATYFTLKLESKYDAPVNMRVVDVLGRVVDNRVKLGSNATVEVGHNYQSGTYFAEFIQGNRRRVVQLLKIKR